MAFSKKNLIFNNHLPAMILAAGLGERFRPHTLQIPKPAIPFLNIPFLYYSIHLAEFLGTKKIVINTHHLPHIIGDLATQTPQLTAEMTFTYEQPILGSGGGIKNAQRYLEGFGCFLTLNADSVYFIKDFSFWSKAQKKIYDENALAILILVEHPKVGTHYNAVWINDQGYIKGIGKTAPGNSKLLSGLHFTGMQILSDEVFSLIPHGPCDIFRDVLLPAIEKGEKVLGLQVPGLWYEGGSEVGYLEDTGKLLSELCNHDKNSIKNFNGNGYVETLLRRFWTDYPQREKILDGPNLLIHKTAKVSSYGQLEGYCVIGAWAQIGDFSHLCNCVIANGVHIPAKTKISSQLIIANP